MLNMSKQETLATRYGEMVDMISCFSIYHGAEPKRERKITDFDEIMKLR